MSSNNYIARPHQENGLNICKNAPEKRFIIEGATGSGKNKLIQTVAEHYGNVLLLTDRVSVIDQLKDEQIVFGLNYDIFTSQKITRNLLILKKYDIVLIDECHTIFTNVLKYIKDNDIKLIGFTATATKSALLIYYEKVYNIATYNQMKELGYLVGIDFYSTNAITTNDINFTSTGSITNESMEKIEDRLYSIKANLVQDYKDKENNNSGIILCPSIKSAQEIKSEFIDAGISCATYLSDDTMTYNEKRQVLNFFRIGALKILVSVDALSKGFDAPISGFMMDCRPRSFKHGLDGFIQSVGRNVRIMENKPTARVYDYVNNCAKFMDRYAIHCEHGGEAIINKNFKIHKCENCKAEYDSKPPTICRQCKNFSQQFVECISCRHMNNVRALTCFKCNYKFDMKCPHCANDTSYLVSTCIHCLKTLDSQERKRIEISIIQNEIELKKIIKPKATSIWGMANDESYKCFASTIKYKIEYENKKYKNPVFYAYYLWEEYTKCKIPSNKLAFIYSNAKPELYIDCVNFIKKKGKQYYDNKKGS
jgi:superfamily II DNA or RNA helicase